MSGHALAARTLLAAADELVGGPPVEASAAALAGDNPLVVGADVVVGRRIIQRRVQNRRIDADVAQ